MPSYQTVTMKTRDSAGKLTLRDALYILENEVKQLGGHKAELSFGARVESFYHHLPEE